MDATTTSPGATLGAAGVDLDKVITLFRGPNSAALHERHIATIEKLCAGSEGFALRDLGKVQQVLELTLELLRGGSSGFLEPACKLVRALGRPYVKKAATDEFKLLGSVESILRAIGKAFDEGTPVELQLHAAETLRSFANAQGPRPSALDLASAAAVPPNAGSKLHQYFANQRLLVDSGVARAVIRGLAAAILSGDELLIASLTATLLTFSYLPANCRQLVEQGVLSCMPALLALGYKHDVTAMGVELLWNLLEQAPVETKAQVSEPQPPLVLLAQAGDMPPFDARQQQQQQQEVVAVVEEEPRRPPSRPVSSVSFRATSAASANGEQGQGQPLLAEVSGASQPGLEAEPSSYSDEAGQGTEASATGPGPLDGVEAGDGADTGLEGGKGVSRSTSLAGHGQTWRQVYGVLGEALSGLFQSVLVQGCREADKELRNSVLVTVTLLLPGSAGFAHACHDAGLTATLLAVACAPELASGAPYVKPWALTTEELDLELKLLAWGAVTGAAVALTDALDAVRGSAFVPLLLQYLDSGSPGPAVLRWNADRLSNLRSAALASLHRLAPLAPDAYVAASGMAVLVGLLVNCPVPIHVEAALRHLHALATQQPTLAEALGANGALSAALDLAVGATAAWPESLRTSALQLLAALCAPAAGEGAESNRRRLRKADGVTALLGQAAALAKLDPTLPSPLALAVLDAVWCCIVPDRKNAAQFLVNEGMDLLLDHLQIGNRAHRPLLLSLLADLLENPRAHPFFHEWRSDRDKQAAAQLLIGFWKEEDSKRGMTVGGVLANPASPLQGLDKRMAWVPGEEVAYGNMAPECKAQLQALTNACDGEQLLAKVYAVFRVVGMSSLTYVSLEDQAVLYFIEKYVKFKQGEVWRQIKSEFEAEGMRPTAPDRERLASGIELAEHLATAVKQAQQQVLERHKGGVRQQERKFFEDMQAQKKYEQEMRFFGLEKDKGQLSLAELRAAKQKKEQMLKNSIDVSSFGLESLSSTSDELATAAG